MELTVSDKNRIQVAGHAVELAGGGGAIGSCSCSGRRSRGHPIPCSCTARPCTQGGGETKVQRETLSKITQAGSVTRDRISIAARHRVLCLLISSPLSSFFFFFLAPLTWFLLGSKKKKKNASRLFKESRLSKVKTSVSFVVWWSILCVIESWRVIIRSGRAGGDGGKIDGSGTLCNFVKLLVKGTRR